MAERNSRPHKRVRVVTAATALWLVINLGACRPDAAIDREAARLRQRTMPPGARPIGEVRPVRRWFSFESTWEFEVDRGWHDYAPSVRGTLKPDFELASVSTSGLTFVRQLPGDYHSLRITVVSGGLPLRVRVVFEARPS